MSEPATEPTPAENPAGGGEPKQDQAFSQADVDRIVRERVKREREKFADYDDLKQKAKGAQTAEERIAALESEIAAQQLAVMRARIATEFGLNEKQAAAIKYAPSEEAAREIAEGLAADLAERKKQGNHVPAEGTSTRPADNELAAFSRQFFGD